MVQTDTISNKVHISFLFERAGVEVWVKRDDLIDPLVSGNKLFKLALNIEEAKALGYNHITTFGGVFSNHIAATAKYCKQVGLSCTGIIRGEKTSELNPTLSTARENGMQLKFISRSEYQQKKSPNFLKDVLGLAQPGYVIPEGGANALGIKGAIKMVTEDCGDFSHFVVAIGTGTTAAGIAAAAKEGQTVIGVPVHRHSEILTTLAIEFPEFKSAIERVEVLANAHFGGYAKWNMELIELIREVHALSGVKLEPIYTGKAMAGLLEHIDKHHIKPGSKVLFFHTGGMQGLRGFEERFRLEVFPQGQTNSH